MLSFKKFGNQKSKGYFIDGNGHVVPSEPISIFHYKGIKEELEYTPYKYKSPLPINKPEDTKSLDTLPGQSVEGDRKDHFFKKSDEIHSVQGEPEKKQLDALHKYSAYNHRTGDNASSKINRALIDNYKRGLSPTEGLSKVHQNVHKHVSDLTSKPIGKESHVYSGTSIKGDEAAKESKIFYSPAHISTSHDVKVAANFASRKGVSSRGYNIMHIHLKPEDKAYHVGNHSLFRGEHETIIPAGTKLKYNNTTHHHDEDGAYYKVHHYTVDSQQ